MSELIDKDAFLKQERKWYCENCDRRKGVKNGRKCFVYEIGEVPCRACDVDDVLDDLEDFPTASPWHRVEDVLPEESKEYIVYLQMGTGVEAPDCLGKVDLSYVTSMYFKKEKGIWFDEYDESYNGDLSLVDTVNDYHVTHWMPFPEPPKEDA